MKKLCLQTEMHNNVISYFHQQFAFQTLVFKLSKQLREDLVRNQKKVKKMNPISQLNVAAGFI
jgi:hypothetical protein